MKALISEFGLKHNVRTLTCDIHNTTFEVFEKRLNNILTAHFRCPSCLLDEAPKQEAEARQRENRYRLTSYETARIPRRYFHAQLSDLITTQANANAASVVIDYINSLPSLLNPIPNLFLMGSVGTGKTHASCVLIMEAIRQGWHTRYFSSSELVDYAWKNREEESMSGLQLLGSTQLLVIDEIGRSTGKGFDKVMFDIVDRRYNNMLPTVIVGNATRQ